MVQQSTYWESLREMDYRDIIEGAHRAGPPLDRYLAVRSALILGEYALAAQWLQAHAAHFESFYLDFLKLQQSTFTRLLNQDEVVQLIALGNSLPRDPYLVGEYHFICGYALNRKGEFKQAVRHHLLAGEFYKKAGLMGQYAASLSNLCVSYNHLNDRHLYRETLDQLEAVAAEHPNPRIRSFYLRNHAYHLLSIESLEASLECLDALGSIYQTEKRVRDYSGVLFLKGYVLYALKRSLEFIEWEKEQQQTLTTDEHRRAIDTLVQISKMGTLLPEQAESIFEEISAAHDDLVKRMFLFDALFRLMERCQLYEPLLKLSRLAGQYALKSQMVVCLIETRYFEVLALIKTGQFFSARRLLSTYLSDAREQESAQRLQKAHLLSAQLSDETFPVPGPDGFVLVLDTVSERISINGRSISIGRYPKLVQFFQVLIENGKTSIADLFFRVYRVAYHPVYHEKRIASLLSRARELLGQSTLIERREGQIFLAENVESRVESTHRKRKQHRRDQILSFCRRQERPVTIADLESHFGCTRRTLQLDLKYLVSLNKLGATGQARRRCYIYRSAP